jgi:hypothetical protein
MAEASFYIGQLMHRWTANSRAAQIGQIQVQVEAV